MHYFLNNKSSVNDARLRDITNVFIINSGLAAVESFPNENVVHSKCICCLGRDWAILTIQRPEMEQKKSFLHTSKSVLVTKTGLTIVQWKPERINLYLLPLQVDDDDRYSYWSISEKWGLTISEKGAADWKFVVENVEKIKLNKSIFRLMFSKNFDVGLLS